MPNSIDQLRSGIYSYFKSNRFKVLIDNTFLISAHSVSIPNIVTNFSENNSYFLGRSVKTPSGISHTECSITFYVTVDESDTPREIEYFLKWVENPGGEKSVFKTTNDVVEVNYVDDYARNIIIQLFNDNGDNINTWKLLKAYPTSINYSDLSYASTNQLMEVVVNFEYEKLENDTVYS